MRTTIDPKLETGRVRTGPWRSDPSDGVQGAFFVLGPVGRILRIIASDARDWDEAQLPGEKWEHVSVSLAEHADKTPTWGEMDFVRGLFFAPDETVLQFHPPKSAKVNVHEGCLHLWRPTLTAIPLPPQICV